MRITPSHWACAVSASASRRAAAPVLVRSPLLAYEGKATDCRVRHALFWASAFRCKRRCVSHISPASRGYVGRQGYLKVAPLCFLWPPACQYWLCGAAAQRLICPLRSLPAVGRAALGGLPALGSEWPSWSAGQLAGTSTLWPSTAAWRECHLQGGNTLRPCLCRTEE